MFLTLRCFLAVYFIAHDNSIPFLEIPILSFHEHVALCLQIVFLGRHRRPKSANTSLWSIFPTSVKGIFLPSWRLIGVWMVLSTTSYVYFSYIWDVLSFWKLKLADCSFLTRVFFFLFFEFIYHVLKLIRRHFVHFYREVYFSWLSCVLGRHRALHLSQWII